MKTIYMLLIIVLNLVIISCRNESPPEEIDSDLIMITHQQYNSEVMTLGSPELREFEEVVDCKGHIISPPGGKAQVTAIIPGTAGNVYCSPGQQVHKGQALFDIGGNDLIDLQRDFAETAALLKRLQSDYNRAKALYKEKIGSEKDFLFVESEYKAANAKYAALKLKLDLAGLDAGKIESGELIPYYKVKSPINGYITSSSLAIGKFIDQQSVTMEIVDISRLQLKLSVFVRDITKLKPGQKIEFRLPDGANDIYSATLTAIGTNIDENSRAIDCYGQFDKTDHMIRLGNVIVEARIIVGTVSALSVPDAALIESEGQYYLLMLVKEDDTAYFLKRIKTSVGRQSNGYTEILEKPAEGKILTSGVYNILVE